MELKRENINLEVLEKDFSILRTTPIEILIKQKFRCYTKNYWYNRLIAYFIRLYKRIKKKFVKFYKI